MLLEMTTCLFTLKAIKCVWRPGFARTHWERILRSPDPVAGFEGWAPWTGRFGERVEGKGKGHGVNDIAYTVKAVGALN